MLFAPNDIDGIENALRRLSEKRRSRTVANTLMTLFNESGVTSIKYQGKDGRGVLLESLDQLETLKEVLGPQLSSPDQMSVVVNLRARAWEKLQEEGRMSPVTLQNEEDMREALIARKLKLQYSAQVHQAVQQDLQPPKRRHPEAVRWYMEDVNGDVVDLDPDALTADTYVCQAGEEDWVTAEEAGLVKPKPKRRKPAKRKKAKDEADAGAEVAESAD